MIAASATRLRRRPIGTRSIPASEAYFNRAATPANNTSMPIFTGTLPSVNQFLMRAIATVARPGWAGLSGRAGEAARGRGAAPGMDWVSGGGTAGVGASEY